MHYPLIAVLWLGIGEGICLHSKLYRGFNLASVGQEISIIWLEGNYPPLNLHFPHRLLVALFKLAVEGDMLIDRQRLAIGVPGDEL